jgi:hypothetical protein
MNTTLQNLRTFTSQEIVLLHNKKKQHLKEMGLGNRPNAAEALKPEDEEELYNCGYLYTIPVDICLVHLVVSHLFGGIQSSHLIKIVQIF